MSISVRESTAQSFDSRLREDKGVVVFPILLYSVQTRVLYRKRIRLLEQCRYFRSIPGIKYQIYVFLERRDHAFLIGAR